MTKNRLLCFFASLLIAFSGAAGSFTQRAFFSDGEIEFVSLHSENQNHALLLEKSFEQELRVSEESSRSSLRVARGQKRSFSQFLFFLSENFKNSDFSVFSFSSVSISHGRILLLPRVIKSIIFLQTIR